MNDEKRTHAAASLRTFCDEQLQHLFSLVDNFSHHHPPQEQRVDTDQQLIDDFVDAANAKMRAVQGFSEKLRQYVCALYQHVLQIAIAIPPVIDLNPNAFNSDPLINSLFVNADELNKLVRISPEVTTYLRSHDKDQFPTLFALLTAYKSQKSVLGIGLLGDMLVRDVHQQVVNFSSHELHMPCADHAELETTLKKYLFDRVVNLLKQKMALQMANQSMEANQSYEARVNSLANPSVYLNTLIEYLQKPEQLLSIHKSHFRLNKLGIKLADDDTQCANEFDIHELVWGENSRNVILQITYLR